MDVVGTLCTPFCGTQKQVPMFGYLLLLVLALECLDIGSARRDNIVQDALNFSWRGAVLLYPFRP